MPATISLKYCGVSMGKLILSIALGVTLGVLLLGALAFGGAKVFAIANQRASANERALLLSNSKERANKEVYDMARADVSTEANVVTVSEYTSGCVTTTSNIADVAGFLQDPDGIARKWEARYELDSDGWRKRFLRIDRD